ncbi:unnamed protein product [Tenebrio molitor]|nr:unnamed protein product [Tenebrio molitor]
MEQLKSWKTRFGRFSKSTKVGVLCTVGLSKSFWTNSGPDSFRSHHKKNQDERRFGQLNEYKIHRRNSTKCLKRRIKQELHNCGSNYY